MTPIFLASFCKQLLHMVFLLIADCTNRLKLMRSLKSPCCSVGLILSLKAEVSGRQWLTPEILAISETEIIRKITVLSQPRQILCEPLS
jgi:hypothetical protein